MMTLFIFLACSQVPQSHPQNSILLKRLNVQFIWTIKNRATLWVFLPGMVPIILLNVLFTYPSFGLLPKTTCTNSTTQVHETSSPPFHECGFVMGSHTRANFRVDDGTKNQGPKI